MCATLYIINYIHYSYCKSPFFRSNFDLMTVYREGNCYCKLIRMSFQFQMGGERMSRISLICSLTLKPSRGKQVYVHYARIRQCCEPRSLPKSKSSSFGYAPYWTRGENYVPIS